ncbi:MAG: hypothetical protein QM757_14890 [Paludibaculum sp.]
MEAFCESHSTASIHFLEVARERVGLHSEAGAAPFAVFLDIQRDSGERSVSPGRARSPGAIISLEAEGRGLVVHIRLADVDRVHALVIAQALP